jgi:hypothetical protein
MNLIVIIMTCICIVMLSLFCQLPSCNLFTQHMLFAWRVATSVDSWEPRSIFHHQILTLSYMPLEVVSTIFWCHCLCVTATATVLLLLLLSYYCCFHITPVTSAFPGAAELTTPLLRLISILCLPLCRINKFGFYFPRRLLRSPILVSYQEPSFSSNTTLQDSMMRREALS